MLRFARRKRAGVFARDEHAARQIQFAPAACRDASRQTSSPHPSPLNLTGPVIEQQVFSYHFTVWRGREGEEEVGVARPRMFAAIIAIVGSD